MTAAEHHLPAPELLEIDLALIAFDPDQPRTRADETLLDQLVKSLRAHGLEQPVVVTPHPDPEIAVHKPYLLLHGSRRCTAALRAGLARIPAVLRHEDIALDDRIMRQLAENDEREDLGLHDRAKAVLRAFESSELSQAEFGRKHGKGRPWISGQLWLAKVEGLTAEALAGRHIRHGETARLYDQLSSRTQQRLLDNARASGEPITLALVRRFLPAPAGEGEEPAATDEHREGSPPDLEEDEVRDDEDGASSPARAMDLADRIPIYVRAETVPRLLGHFGLRPGDPPDPDASPDEAAALLAAYLESLAQPPPAAVQT